MAAQLAISSDFHSTAAPARVSWMGIQDQNAEADALLAPGTVEHFAHDREIFVEGEPAESFFKVVSGVVRSCKFLNDGRRQIEAFYVPGDVFGFEPAADRMLSAEAVSDCTLVSYRRRGMEVRARKDAALSHHLYSCTVRSLAQAQNHSLLLGRRGAIEKVSSFLLDWAGHSSPADTINLAMTRQDIADYLGLTIETVSRTLTQMERAKLIDLPGARQVRIRNLEALTDLIA